MTEQVRVRLARGEDVTAIRALAELAGVGLEGEVLDAVDTGTAGVALRAGLRGGPEQFMMHMAEKFTGPQGADLRRLLPPTTLVLVAEHAEHGVVGAVAAFPPAGVVQQLIEQLRQAGVNGQRLFQTVMAAVMWIVRVKALAVDESMRGTGIGGALLHRCQQLYAHCGYMLMYGQMNDSPALERFYRRHGFDVLERDTGFDPWVVLGVHADVRPDPGERTFVRHQSPRPDRRPGRVPAPRRSKQQFDPGTLALHDDDLPSLLMHGSGEFLAVQFLPKLWIKLAEGKRANACLDACVQLRYAYQQFGIPAEILPVGVVIHHPDGARTQYATDQPRWHDDSTLLGHTVLLLSEHDKLIDATIEQVPEIRDLRQGPVIGRIPEQSRRALYDATTSFGVQREHLLIEYQPVRPEVRDRLLQAPLLTRNDAQYQRAGVNLAALALKAFRDAGATARIRRTTTFPRLLDLFDAIGDAPIDVDETTEDVMIDLPAGPVRLDQVLISRRADT